MNLYSSFKHTTLFSLLVGLSVLSASLHADEFIWNISNYGHNWSVSSAWDPTTRAPGAGDTAVMSGLSGAIRVDRAIEIADFIADNRMQATVTIMSLNSPVTTSLSITGTLNASGNDKNAILQFSNDNPDDHLMDLTVNNISITNQAVIMGRTQQGLNSLTSAGTTTVGANGFLFFNVTSTATLGEVTLEGGTLALANAVNSMDNVSRTVSVGGLNGLAGVVEGVHTVADHGGSGLNNTYTRSAALEIDTDTGTRHTFGGTGVIQDKSLTGVYGAVTLSLLKKGAGTQILSSANTYTGPTTISEGTLVAANTEGSATGFGAVTVQSGGILAGTGFIGGPVTTVSSGIGASLNGHLSPGDEGAGTLTINNSLIIGDHTFLDFDLTTPDVAGGTGGNDFVNVQGTLGSDGNVSVGTSVMLNLHGESVSDGVYKLIGYTGSLTGADNLSSWTATGLSSEQTATFGYSGADKDIFVTITTTAIPEPAATGLAAALAAIFTIGATLRRNRQKD